MLADACEDLTAFTPFPVAHWRKLSSTDPLERLNKRSRGAPTSWGSSPMTPRFYGLVGAVLLEAHDEWQVAERRYQSAGSMPS
jgi:putative transposase